MKVKIFLIILEIFTQLALPALEDTISLWEEKKGRQRECKKYCVTVQKKIT